MEATMTTSKAGPTENLWSLIKDLRYPVLTTRRTDGGLQSRPMTMQNRDSDPLDFLWFFTPRDSEQVDDLQWDSSVSIVFADPGKPAYVAVFGSAAVVEDASRKKVLWSAQAASWFAGGPEDPGLALVRVRIIQADCWDAESNTVTHLFKLDNGARPYKPPFDQRSSSAMRH
jgi:general stress protein 26